MKKKEKLLLRTEWQEEQKHLVRELQPDIHMILSNTNSSSDNLSSQSPDPPPPPPPPPNIHCPLIFHQLTFTE